MPKQVMEIYHKLNLIIFILVEIFNLREDYFLMDFFADFINSIKFINWVKSYYGLLFIRMGVWEFFNKANWIIIGVV